VVAVLPPHLAGTLRYRRHICPSCPVPCCALSPLGELPRMSPRSTVHRIVARLSPWRSALWPCCAFPRPAASIPFPALFPALFVALFLPPASHTLPPGLMSCFCHCASSAPPGQLTNWGFATPTVTGSSANSRPPPLGHQQLSPTGQALTPVTRESDTAETDRAVQRSPECSSGAQPARRRKGLVTLLAREDCC
jgi:hypothetical protein